MDKNIIIGGGLQYPPNSFLITNEGSNTLINTLTAKINSYNSKVDLCIISGFFNAKAFEAIAQFNDKLNSVCIILGKESQSIKDDNIIFYLKDNDLEVLNQLDDIKASKIAIQFIKNLKITIHTLKDKSVLIHSKMYFLHDKNNDNITQNAIIGSSNFTASGLGLYNDESNKELNLLCDSKSTTKECEKYFTQLKSQCVDSTNAVLDYLQTSYFYHSPKDILEKIAPFFINNTQLDEKEQRGLKKGVEAYKLFDFQKSAAEELLKRLKNYSVALLADPVGSGKTLVALAVAFNYKRISIITPPKLKTQWESYGDSENEAILNQNIKFFSYDEVINKTDNINFLQHSDLIIIDESHHFRNTNNRHKKLKERLQNNDSHLLLLSATPINNNYADLANQLTILKNHITINEKSLNPIEICKQADKKTDKLDLSPEYYKLCNVIFSRSSNEIEKYLQGLGNPLPKKNIKIDYKSSVPKHINFDIEDLIKKIDCVNFCIYDPYKEEYLCQEIRDELKKYDNLENLGAYATPRGFLSMLLIKALESSVDSFQSTLKHIIDYYKRFLSDDFNPSDNEKERQDDEFPYRLTMLISKGFKSQLKDKFYTDLKHDLKILESIKTSLEAYKESDFTQSEKFQTLKEIIENIDIKSQKLIIFTESEITANALTKALKNTFSNLNIESITGKTSRYEFKKRKERFSPHSLKANLKSDESEIDILVATDCLSEGQNLQDCANLLNWDIAFNPVRAIQRIGRIWRINSLHTNNYITHFFPDMQLEKYIDLECKLKYKLDAAASASSIDSPFSANKNSPDTHKKLREKHYNALKNETIAIEDENKEEYDISNIYALMEQFKISGEVKTTKDGIFSITKSTNFKENTLFALLQESENLYPCIYYVDECKLDSGVSGRRKKDNLEKIIKLTTTDKAQELFSGLEDFTSDYSDISGLKNIFTQMIEKLKDEIKEYDKKTNDKQSDGGIVFDSKRTFRLIAWLLINPNFDALSKFKTKDSK